MSYTLPNRAVSRARATIHDAAAECVEAVLADLDSSDVASPTNRLIADAARRRGYGKVVADHANATFLDHARKSAHDATAILPRDTGFFITRPGRPETKRPAANPLYLKAALTSTARVLRSWAERLNAAADGYRAGGYRMGTPHEALHLTISDAHKALLSEARGDASYRTDGKDFDAFVDEIIERLVAAKVEKARGNFDAASRIFDEAVRAPEPAIAEYDGYYGGDGPMPTVAS